MNNFRKVIQDRMTKTSLRQEWMYFKMNMWNHRYKIFILGGVCTFPFYSPFLKIGYTRFRESLSRFVENRVKYEAPSSKIMQAFIKDTIQTAFYDEEIMQQLQEFLIKNINTKEVQDILVKMVLNALQDPKFLSTMQSVGVDLGTSIFTSPDLLPPITSFLSHLFSDELFLSHLSSSCVSLLSESFPISSGLRAHLQSTFSSTEISSSLSTLLRGAFTEVLSSEETASHFRAFVYSVVRSEIEGHPRNVGDVLFEKVVAREANKKMRKGAEEAE